GATEGGHRLSRTHRPRGRPDRAAVSHVRGRWTGRPIFTDREPDMSTATATRQSPTETQTLRRLSGFKPTGELHLGNYLGAIRPTLDAQRTTESIVMIADLHALTAEH